eukprot:m.127401 g.127401  ORF g.127401 m.127401 type:complete len:60 (-) comp13008_c0_seq1:2959-3138(-)
MTQEGYVQECMETHQQLVDPINHHHLATCSEAEVTFLVETTNLKPMSIVVCVYVCMCIK